MRLGQRPRVGPLLPWAGPWIRRALRMCCPVLNVARSSADVIVFCRIHLLFVDFFVAISFRQLLLAQEVRVPTTHIILPHQQSGLLASVPTGRPPPLILLLRCPQQQQHLPGVAIPAGITSAIHLCRAVIRREQIYRQRSTSASGGSHPFLSSSCAHFRFDNDPREGERRCSFNLRSGDAPCLGLPHEFITSCSGRAETR